MNVLIVGSGAREHALTWKALQSPLTTAVYCAPGNAATAAIAVNTGIEATDLDGIAAFVAERDVTLTVASSAPTRKVTRPNVSIVRRPRMPSSRRIIVWPRQCP